MLLSVNLQTSATAQHTNRPDFNESGVLTKAEGVSQQGHNNGEGTAELHTCWGCVTSTEGSLQNYELHNGSEGKETGSDNLGTLVVNVFLSWIKMLLKYLAKLVSGSLANMLSHVADGVNRLQELYAATAQCHSTVPQCSFQEVTAILDRLYSQLTLA